MNKLQKQIKNKLEKLSKLLDKIDEIRVIDSDDANTWDLDSFYNLVENLKSALNLAEDIPSLLEEYQEENEDYE